LGLTLLALFSTVVLFELVKSPNTWLVRALDWGPLALVGRLSYAMYLIHFQAIDLGRILLYGKMRSPTTLNFVLMCGLFIVLTLATAALLHVLIELPFLRLKARFASARTPSA
jgi:peptidoglycan/LPS O-acetylase OafA/YrhL